MPNTTYCYEPRKGHGLPHDPFNAIVGPRPIGWISSRNADGVLNAAPYSFFTAFNYVPPIVGFSSIGYKDSVRNIEQTGEFVWNLVTRSLAQAMNQTCAAVAPEVSEFELAGLTPMASRLLVNGLYDTASADHILRGGGPADYFSIGPEQLFKIYRPRAQV